MFSLWVQQGRLPFRHYAIDKVEITLGSDPDCDIVLPGDEVSAQHARILYSEGRFVVVDLRSEIGTYVADRRVTRPMMLREGERIIIAGYHIWVAEPPADDDSPGDDDESTDWPDSVDSLDERASEPLGQEATGVPFEPPFELPDSVQKIGPADEVITLESLPDAERSLLEMVHQRPHSDEPRLVYADWLLERGDPRGELITLQCAQRSQAPPPSSARPTPDAGKVRAQALLEACGPTWLQPMLHGARASLWAERDGALVAREDEDMVFAMRIERGFLAHPLCVTSGRLARDADGLHRLSPTIYEVLGMRRQNFHSVWYHARARGPAGDSLHDLVLKCSSSSRDIHGSAQAASPMREFHTKCLLNELVIADLVAHRNIVRHLGMAYWGNHGDRALAIEWIGGSSLRDILREADGDPFEPQLACSIMRQVLLALAHMHTARDRRLRPAGIWHGSLNSLNVIIDFDGAVKLNDLSWAQANPDAIPYPRLEIDSLDYPLEPERDFMVSFLSYRAPEELLDQRDGNPAFDVFAAGTLLYEMVCGRHPFYDQSGRRAAMRLDVDDEFDVELEDELEGELDDGFEATIQEAILEPTYAAPGELVAIPRSLERVILRAMAGDPEERYQNATDMLDALEAIIAEEGWVTGPAVILRELGLLLSLAPLYLG